MHLSECTTCREVRKMCSQLTDQSLHSRPSQRQETVAEAEKHVRHQQSPDQEHLREDKTSYKYSPAELDSHTRISRNFLGRFSASKRQYNFQSTIDFKHGIRRMSRSLRYGYKVRTTCDHRDRIDKTLRCLPNLDYIAKYMHTTFTNF